ncbi:MAG TPA: hypothetical protein VFT75_10310 [Nocardioidaceae bacterium]|jgi:hypothetical protein|nr:hypothetical protein [Nocardioidaceae bacterium]
MSRPPRIEPAGDVVARVAATALALPDAYEEDAWTGVRWRVRSKTAARRSPGPSPAGHRSYRNPLVAASECQAAGTSGKDIWAA